jgi:hypothetical protein
VALSFFFLLLFKITSKRLANKPPRGKHFQTENHLQETGRPWCNQVARWLQVGSFEEVVEAETSEHKMSKIFIAIQNLWLDFVYFSLFSNTFVADQRKKKKQNLKKKKSHFHHISILPIPTRNLLHLIAKKSKCD